MLKFDWNILFAVINLIIFYLIMSKFFFKKIMNTMDKRRELIDKQFKEADDTKEEANRLKKQYEDKLENADDEKLRIINEAKDSAKSEYDKIIDRAKADADKLKADARKSAEQECEAARRSVNEEIASLAMQAAEKVVGRSVSVQTDSEIFDEFLKESSDSNE